MDAPVPVNLELARDQSRILHGFLYPDIGWYVLSVPGLSPMTELLYYKQEVPPPLGAWVVSSASDKDIVFGSDLLS